MKIKNISSFLEEQGLPKFRLQQIIKAVYTDAVSSFTEITTLSKDIRQKLADNENLLSFEVEQIFISDDKKSFKALLKLRDGNFIETVLLASKEGLWSSCISSQVGCAMNCSFCATGGHGFTRSLKAEEITDQVLFWRQYFKKNKLVGSFLNIIFMGMGEPFANYDEVRKSINLFTDPQVFNIGARHISVSTSGVVSGIKKIASDFPQINLAISIIMPTDEKRSLYMPVNDSANLAKLREAIDYYFSKNNRKVFLEYIMFDKINDQKQDADALIKFINSGTKPALLHVNLISYNGTDPRFKSSSKESIAWFKNYLLKNKVSTTIRKSLGKNIKAACGQLAGKK